MLWQGLVLVLGGAFCRSLCDVTNKKLLNKQAPADCISTINFLVSGTLLLTIALIFNPPKIESWFGWFVFDFRHGFFWPLLATSALNVLIGFGGLRAMKYGDSSLIAPIGATQPMIVLIPSMLILGETPTPLGYAGLLLLAIGTYTFGFDEQVFLIDPKTREKKAWEPPVYLRWMGKFARYAAPWHMLFFNNRGVKIALLVACLSAVAINFDKKAVMLSSSTTFAPAVATIFMGIVGLIKILRTSEWRKLNKSHRISLTTNPLVLVTMLICYWTAFDYGLAAYVGALRRFSIVFVMILSFFLLKEQGVKKRWPGAIIMAAGAVLISL